MSLKACKFEWLRMPLFCAALVILVGSWVFLPDLAWAQGSLGIGRPEPAIQPQGPLGGLLFWIQEQQQSFYRQLTGALKNIRDEEGFGFLLVGLSFAYGVFHAAGPGHGKAVISSYMIANEVAARRGILLAFASAFLQAVTAVALIGMLFFLLRGTGLRQGTAVGWLETVSYAGVTLLGLWLLASKTVLRKRHHSHSQAAHHRGHQHTHGDEDCGHSHAPDPAGLDGNMGLRQAWTAIVAVGLRPCSGALIVLTFAFVNGIYAAGIGSAFAMALGTGLTVAILAAIAVWAKDLAIALNRNNARADRMLRLVEIGGALMVFLFGVVLLSASLA